MYYMVVLGARAHTTHIANSLKLYINEWYICSRRMFVLRSREYEHGELIRLVCLTASVRLHMWLPD